MIEAVDSFSGFSVNDLAVARTFYVDTLGLKLLDDSMGLRLELPGGSELFVYEKDDHQPASFTVLNFVVTDIGVAVQDLQAKGVIFERYDLGGNMKQDEHGILRGRAVNMGPDIGWFTDPAGNVLAVLQS